MSYRNEKKTRCRPGTSPVPECPGTELRNRTPEYRCKVSSVILLHVFSSLPGNKLYINPVQEGATTAIARSQVLASVALAKAVEGISRWMESEAENQSMYHGQKESPGVCSVKEGLEGGISGSEGEQPQVVAHGEVPA
jgi:hypothetical protein